jgi:hypothetical protein
LAAAPQIRMSGQTADIVLVFSRLVLLESMR